MSTSNPNRNNSNPNLKPCSGKLATPLALQKRGMFYWGECPKCHEYIYLWLSSTKATHADKTALDTWEIPQHMAIPSLADSPWICNDCDHTS